MEPVINPWLFYFIEFANTIKAVAVLFIFASVLAFFLLMVSEEIKFIKITVAVFVISLMIIIFTPSSDTIIKMVIAKNVTYDVVNATKDVVVQVYNDILALFQK